MGVNGSDYDTQAFFPQAAILKGHKRTKGHTCYKQVGIIYVHLLQLCRSKERTECR